MVWPGIFFAPLLFLTNLSVAYALVPWACQSQHHAVLHVVTGGAFVLALVVDTVGFALRPQSAYASVCGPGSSCSSGWTVFCATINNGVNACPPGSIAAGWWKADGASLCGGRARYIVDCNATCSRCAGCGSRRWA